MKVIVQNISKTPTIDVYENVVQIEYTNLEKEA